MSEAQPLTRAELAQFLPTQRAIKAFEALFRQATTLPPDAITALIEEVSLIAASSDARAQQAIDTLSQLANAIEMAAFAPSGPPNGNLKDIRVGESQNHTEWDGDGTMRFKGDATVWQDIDFPIIIRTVGPNIPTLTTLQGNVTAPQWAVNDYNVCEAQELIHLWKEGSAIQWHVHFVTNGLDATDRYVNWEVEWFWVDVDGQLSGTTTSTSGDILIPANTPDKTMLAKQVAMVTFAGHIAGHVYARLRRIASTGAAPTGNPWCSMLQMHVECDTVGSRYLFIK
jgi:hypothetical protein